MWAIDRERCRKALLTPTQLSPARINTLKVQEFLSGYGAFTVTSTAKNFRLRAIDPDGSRLESAYLGALIAYGRNSDVPFDAKMHRT